MIQCMTTTEPVLTDDELALVEQLAEARRQRGAWEKIEVEARDSLKALAQARGSDVAITASGAPAYHLSRSERVSIDRNKLEAKWGDAYADVVKVTEIVKVDIDL